jgi:hypothetical protein
MPGLGIMSCPGTRNINFYDLLLTNLKQIYSLNNPLDICPKRAGILAGKLHVHPPLRELPNSLIQHLPWVSLEGASSFA